MYRSYFSNKLLFRCSLELSQGLQDTSNDHQNISYLLEIRKPYIMDETVAPSFQRIFPNGSLKVDQVKFTLGLPTLYGKKKFHNATKLWTLGDVYLC